MPCQLHVLRLSQPPHTASPAPPPLTLWCREFVVNIMSEWFIEAANHTCGNFGERARLARAGTGGPGRSPLRSSRLCRRQAAGAGRSLPRCRRRRGRHLLLLLWTCALSPRCLMSGVPA